MARTFRVNLPADGICTGVVVVRWPDKAAHRAVLAKRMTEEGLTVDHRIDFVEGLLESIEHGRFLGEPLTSADPDWKDCIGEQNKNELFVKYFEERALTRVDEKKFATPSGSSPGGEKNEDAPPAAKPNETASRSRRSASGALPARGAGESQPT